MEKKTHWGNKKGKRERGMKCQVGMGDGQTDCKSSKFVNSALPD